MYNVSVNGRNETDCLFITNEQGIKIILIEGIVPMTNWR